MPNWAEDRARVLRELEVNMVVEAGAGTGKTTLLITRICLAVLARGVEADKIVALTFTEKAAAEIKNRLVTALHQIVQDIQRENEGEPPAEQSLLALLHRHFSLKNEVLLPRARAALARLDRASVGTIHSFCADILRTFPLEAGLSPQAEIDPGAKAARLFNMRWNLFLDTQLGLHAPCAEKWKAVLPQISLDELKTFTQTLCSGKIEQYDYFSHASMLAAVCEEKAGLARAWSEAFLDPKKKTPRNVEKALLWAEGALTRAAAFLRGKEVPVPPEINEPPALSSTLPKGWEEETYEDARGLVQFAEKMCPEKQRIFLQAYELVKEVAAQIRADYAQEGVLSFDDLIVKTRNLVQRNLYVRRLLKEKLDVLFVDEFQDTDPVQGELLLFLAEEKSSSATRWQDVKLQPGKLVVVGDPKQSIYRFRGADITAYELFTQLILNQGGVKCFLRQNYRSVPDIVSLANSVCRRAMVQQTAFQPAYEPIYPTKSPGPNAVRWLFVNPPETGALADDLRDNQAEMVARWIKENVGNLTLANGEKLAYKDIVLLSRAATTAGPYTRALRRHGIAFTADSEKDFFKRQEINDFLNFLRVVLDPSDTTALVGVLRSPLGGMTDEEIYQLAVRGELTAYASTSCQAAARVYALVAEFSRRVGRTDVQTFLADVLGKTFLPEVCAAAYEGEQTLEILTQLVSRAPQILGDRPATVGQFLTAVQDILNTTPEQISVGSESTVDAVSVMTVHKSKGLDFPVVILVDLSKKETTSGASLPLHLFSWQYNMHGLRAGKICDANLAFLEEEQKKHERCEEIRILYVALTRAKEQLLLVADGRKGAAKAAHAFAQAGLFPNGTAEMISTDEVNVPVSYAFYVAPEKFRYRQSAVVNTYTVPGQLAKWREEFDKRRARYQAALAEQNLSPSARVATDDLLSGPQRAAAEVGTSCHRAMQILLTEPQTAPLEAVRQAVSSAGSSEREKEVAEIMVPFASSALFNQLRACKLLAAEMPFAYAAENGLIENGVMDAVLECSDGTIWVVDYKTDKLPAGGTQALLEKYRPQLAVYQQAARQIFPGKTVRCSAVFLRTCQTAQL